MKEDLVSKLALLGAALMTAERDDLNGDELDNAIDLAEMLYDGLKNRKRWHLMTSLPKDKP